MLLVGVKTQGIGFVSNRLPVRALDEPIIPFSVIFRCASFMYVQKSENIHNLVTHLNLVVLVVGVGYLIHFNEF